MQGGSIYPKLGGSSTRNRARASVMNAPTSDFMPLLSLNLPNMSMKDSKRRSVDSVSVNSLQKHLSAFLRRARTCGSNAILAAGHLTGGGQVGSDCRNPSPQGTRYLPGL